VISEWLACHEGHSGMFSFNPKYFKYIHTEDRLNNRRGKRPVKQLEHEGRSQCRLKGEGGRLGKIGCTDGQIRKAANTPNHKDGAKTLVAMLRLSERSLRAKGKLFILAVIIPG
jgi:hypothetical protein